MLKTVTKILLTTQNDLFKQSDYWNILSTTAYTQHSNRNTHFTPNKPKESLKDAKTNTVFTGLSSILLLMMDEYILTYSKR